MGKNKGWKILITGLIIIGLIAGIIIYINGAFKPLPQEKRNISTTDIKMLVDMKDKAGRTPIIRTYTREEFDNLGEGELKKLGDIIGGNIEGDIPALEIKNGRGILKLSFEEIKEDNQEKSGVKILADNKPQVKIQALDAIYGSNSPKTMDGILEKEEEGDYFFEIEKPYDDEDMDYYENDEFFMQLVFVKVTYTVDGQDYISVLAINTIEYKDNK